jgi:hypothetical protein
MDFEDINDALEAPPKKSADYKELFSRISHQSSLLWMPVKPLFRSHTPRAKLEMGKRSTKKTVSLKLEKSIKKDISVKTTRSPRIACNT